MNYMYYLCSYGNLILEFSDIVMVVVNNIKKILYIKFQIFFCDVVRKN